MSVCDSLLTVRFFDFDEETRKGTSCVSIGRGGVSFWGLCLFLLLVCTQRTIEPKEETGA